MCSSFAGSGLKSSKSKHVPSVPDAIQLREAEVLAAQVDLFDPPISKVRVKHRLDTHRIVGEDQHEDIDPERHGRVAESVDAIHRIETPSEADLLATLWIPTEMIP